MGIVKRALARRRGGEEEEEAEERVRRGESRIWRGGWLLSRVEALSSSGR